MAKSNKAPSKNHYTIHLHKRATVVGAVVLLALGGVTLYAYSNSTEPVATISNQPVVAQKELLPEDLSEILSFDEVKTIATEGTDLTVSGLELDTEDTSVVFKVVLSNGQVVILDAVTGQKLDGMESEVEVGDDEPLPDDAKISISFEDARLTAVKLYPDSKVSKIELEVEDGKVVYSVRFQDKARVDVDAESGEVVRTKDPKVEKSESKSGKKSSSDSSSASRSSDDDNDEDEEEDDSSKTRNRSGSNSGSSTDSDEDGDEDSEIRIEGTLFVSNNSYKISAYGTTYTIQYDESLSGLVGKLVRVEGELLNGDVIDAEEVKDRT